LLDEVDHAIDNEKFDDSRFYRPRTGSPKIFVDNIEFISNQLYI